MSMHDFRTGQSFRQQPPDLRGNYGFQPVYAGFWLRACALLIDTVIVAIIAIILGVIIGLIMGFGGANEESAGAVGNLLGICLNIAYYCGLESSERQATFGKQLLGLKVTDGAGNRITFLRALGRYFAKILSAIILLIGYFMAGFTAKKQALHDIICDTLVIKA